MALPSFLNIGSTQAFASTLPQSNLSLSATPTVEPSVFRATQADVDKARALYGLAPQTAPNTQIPPSSPTLGTPDLQATPQTGIQGVLSQLEGLSPEQKQLLGLGETEAQKTQREGLQSSLQRLISLQEQLTKAGAPSAQIQNLDSLIQQQSRTLEQLTPSEFLETQKGLKDVGISQGQLEREVATRREPIARALSDLLFSRSILGQQQQQDISRVQGQIQGVGQQIELQQAIGALTPQGGLPKAIQSQLLENIITPQTIPGVGKIKLPAAQIGDIGTLDTAAKLAQQALRLGELTGFAGIGGFGSGTISEFFAKNFGLGSEEGQQMRNLIGNIKGTIAKLRGGTSFTENEEKLLNTYVPSINDSPLVVKSKINSLLQYIQDKRSSIFNLASGQFDIQNQANLEQSGTNDYLTELGF